MVARHRCRSLCNSPDETIQHMLLHLSHFFGRGCAISSVSSGISLETGAVRASSSSSSASRLESISESTASSRCRPKTDRCFRVHGIGAGP